MTIRHAAVLVVVFGCSGVQTGGSDTATSAASNLPSPKPSAVRLERVCTLPGGPSVVVEVRDAMGNPAATGATLTIRDGSFRDSSKGGYSWDGIRVGAGNRRPGIYEGVVTKPWYEPVRIHGIQAPPGDTICNSAGPTDIRKVTLELLPNAPPIRQVLVIPTFRALGVPEWPESTAVYVDAKPGTSKTVSWSSSDTTVVKVLPTGVVIPQCRRGNGRARVFATSVADPQMRGFGIVEVNPIRNTRGLGPEEAKKKADACQQRLGRLPSR